MMYCLWFQDDRTLIQYISEYDLVMILDKYMSKYRDMVEYELQTYYDTAIFIEPAVIDFKISKSYIQMFSSINDAFLAVFENETAIEKHKLPDLYQHYKKQIDHYYSILKFQADFTLKTQL